MAATPRNLLQRLDDRFPLILSMVVAPICMLVVVCLFTGVLKDRSNGHLWFVAIVGSFLFSLLTLILWRVPLNPRFGYYLSESGRAVGKLFETIRELVANDQYVVGQHAAERLEERGIMEWQSVAGLADGTLLVERPDAMPNPAIEVLEELPDGTEFKAVWSLLPASNVAKLVTVHFFDEE